MYEVMKCNRKAVREDDDEYKTHIANYYNIAHSSNEGVTAQPALLVGGVLKEYQVRSAFYICEVCIYTNIYLYLHIYT